MMEQHTGSPDPPPPYPAPLPPSPPPPPYSSPSPSPVPSASPPSSFPPESLPAAPTTDNHVVETGVTGDTGVIHPNASRNEASVRKCQLLQVIALYIGLFSLGLSFSIIGPTLLELQRLTGTTTGPISAIFTVRAIMGLGGAVLGTLLIDSLNHWLILALVMGVCGVVNLIIPYMGHLAALCIVMGIGGAAGSFFQTGGNKVLFKVRGAWMQTLNFIFGLGALTGPLLAVPFLNSQTNVVISRSTLQPDSTTPFRNTSDVYNITEASLVLYVQPSATVQPTFGDSMTGNFSTIATYHTTKACESRMHWPYTIVGICLCFSSVFLLFMAFFFGKAILQFTNININWKSPKLGTNIQTYMSNQDEKCRMKLMVMLFIFHLTYCIVELHFANYLTTYVVKGLGRSEQEGAKLTSCYWTAVAVGRVLAFGFLKVLKTKTMLMIGVIMSTFSVPVLCLFIHPTSTLTYYFWIFVLGLGVSNILTTEIVWTEKYIPMSTITKTMFGTASSMAEILGPIIIGTVFERFGPRSIMFVTQITLNINFIVAIVMVRYARKNCKKIIPLAPPVQSGSCRPSSRINVQTSDASMIVLQPRDPCVTD